MKILVICQYYYPEPVRIPDICEELVKQGHEVDVVTGVPNYPLGYIYEGYKGKQHRDEVIGGVNVHRCFTIGRRTGAIWRALNYFSFAISSSLYAGKLKDKYDVVFVNQLSPVTMAFPAVVYKNKYKKRLVYYCLDLWPESLIAGGIQRESIIFKVFHVISKYLYKKADKILVSSQQFEKYFEDTMGISKDKLDYLPQYAEDLFKPMQPVEKHTIDFTFAGNVGVFQNVEIIVKTAELFQQNPDIRFHIVGDGISLDKCKELAKERNIKNVIFHGRKPVEEMPKYYAMSDAMLVTLKKDPFISLTLPGKVQSYMAVGKPIIGSIDGEAQKVIRDSECGFCAPAEDEEALKKCIDEFLESNKAALGQNALQYYQNNFRKIKFVSRLIDHLRDV